MNDEWRVCAQFHNPGHGEALIGRIEVGELDHDLDAAFHDQVIVSRSGTQVFLYAGALEQAEKAERVVLDLAREHGWNMTSDLKRWHPVAEEWEDPDIPLPEDVKARQAERAALMATERRETEERGAPEYEVRVNLPSRHEAVRFAEKLKADGWPVVHRWRFILIGAQDEDQAKEIVAKIKPGLPDGGDIAVEGTWKLAYAERPENHPFSVVETHGL
jgi:hypothetical protein